MEELEKLQHNYEVVSKNCATASEALRKKEHECYELEKEKDRLWKLVENLSIALKSQGRS